MDLVVTAQIQFLLSAHPYTESLRLFDVGISGCQRHRRYCMNAIIVPQ